MVRIMFVCHGNICRSPMAEFVMKQLVEEAGLSDRIQVASCATSTEEIWRGIGNPIYPPAQQELRRRGIPFDANKRAVQLTRNDYDTYDYLVAMDSQNVRNIMRIVGADPAGKVFKMLDFAERSGDVADPWYNGHFDRTFDDIYEGCCGLLASIQEGEGGLFDGE